MYIVENCHFRMNIQTHFSLTSIVGKLRKHFYLVYSTAEVEVVYVSDIKDVHAGRRYSLKAQL